MDQDKIAAGEAPVYQYFPWEEVEASLRDQKLEKRHGVNQEYLPEALPCPKCGTAPDQLSWVYVCSPPDAWEQQRGRAGFLLVCDSCRIQVDFFCELKS